VLDGSGDTLGSATTGSDGTFTIGDLPTGAATVVFTVPSGYLDNGTSSILDLPVTLDSIDDPDTLNVAALPVGSPTSITVTVPIDGNPPTSTGQSGVSVTITTPSGGTVTDTSGNPVDPVTTDASGTATLTDLDPGQYQVTLTGPPGFIFTSSGTDTTTVTVDTPGPTVTQGIYQLGSISGTIVDGPGGLPLAGVTVQAIDSSSTVVASTTTTSTDPFTLSGLPPGVYTLSYTAPPGYVFSGTSTTLLTTVIVQSDENLTDVTATVYPADSPTSVSGTVFVDNNGTGVPGSTNPGEAGVTVTLLDAAGDPVTDEDGDTVEPVTTDSAGEFDFPNLPAAVYTVEISQPTRLSLEGTDTSTYSTLVAAPGPFTTVDEGVYQSASVGGTVAQGGSGLAGVTVTLSDFSGDVFTATTASDGTYSITGLPVGLYFVTMTAPSGSVFQGGATATFSTITLGSDQSVSGLNATAYSGTDPTTISGTVYADNDGTDTLDSSNPVVSGATVSLTDASGDPVTDA
jgi:uncharacterized surface anchored protein